MYSVSNDFLTAVQQPGRTFKSQATVKKTGYADLMLSDTQIVSMRLNSTTISGDDFEIGTTCAAELDVELTNIDGSLTTATFEGASITSSIGVLLADGVTVEYCPLGVFFVDSIGKTETGIKIVCYDAMIQLETLYQSNLTFPATLLQIAQEISSKAGLTLSRTTFPNASFSVTAAPSLVGITLRAALSWVAEAGGCFARIDRTGRLEIASYVSSSTTITPANYYSLTHNEQPRAAITQVTIKQNDSDTGVSSGTTGNTYTIIGNPLLANNPAGALTAIYNQLNGFTYMPFESEWQGNPASMAGDKLTITDRNSNTYSAVLTECNLEYAGGVNGKATAKALTTQGQSYKTASPTAGGAAAAVATANQAVSDVQTISNLLAGNITATNIAAGTITADKMKTGTITAASVIIASAAIGTAQIADASIVSAKIGSAAIATANIQDAAITTAKIASASIGTAQIQSAAITTALIGTGAVATAQIADGSITDAKIVTLTANKISAGTIDASKITVTNLNCANLTVGSINGTQIAAATVTSSNIADGTIQGSDIKSGTITNTLIAATTITGDRLVANTVTAAQIAAATITATQIAANTITAAKIAAGTITTTEIAANTITAGDIAAGTITAACIAAGTITGDKIAAGSITADKINVTTLTAQSLNPSGNNYVTCGSVSIANPPSDTAYTGYGLLFENTTLGSPVASITYDATTSPLLFNCPNGFQLACVYPGMSHTGMASSITVGSAGGFNFNNYGGASGFSCDSTGIFAAYTINSSYGGFTTPGQLHMNGTTYPQIYGNGTVLQLNLDSSSSANGIVIAGGTIRPPGDNQVNLGASNHRWATVYASTSAINTSDRNEKNAIASLDTDKATSFIVALNPVSYKYNDGTSGRTHYGMISQDVEDEMTALGMTSTDFAGFIKSPKTETVTTADADGNEVMTEQSVDDEYIYGLRYEEFISPLIKTVQGLLTRCATLEETIKELQAAKTAG